MGRAVTPEIEALDIDLIKKARGESTTTMNSLRMKVHKETEKRVPNGPVALKIK